MNENGPPGPNVDDRPIWDVWLSMYHLPSVTVGMELGVFDALAKEPMNADALAERLDLARRGVGILLTMLAALELVALNDGVYSLSPAAAEYLLREGPFSWAGLLEPTASSMPIHASLRKAVRLRAIDAKPPWAGGELTAAQARRVARFMQAHSAPAAWGVAKQAALSSVNRLLDVGGGSGCFSIAIAARHPRVQCTVFDLPAMCEVTREYIASAGASRVETHPGDMFAAPWPSGHDAVFLSNVLHDWGATTCADLVARAFAALPSGGRIFVHEMLLDGSTPGPRTTAAFSVLMLLSTEGKQLTLDEVRKLLEGAGFAGVRVDPSYGYYSLVSATRP
jgi:hypothetical protein